MNNKAFTLVELIVAFSLTSVIVVMLLQLLFSLKEMQEINDIKTQLLNKQAIINNKISEPLYNKKLSKVTKCDNNQTKCIELTFTDNASLKLEAKGDDNFIKINNETIKLVEDSKIDSIEFVKSNNYENPQKTILTIKVGVKHKYFKDNDFGIYTIYPCDSSVDLDGIILDY